MRISLGRVQFTLMGTLVMLALVVAGCGKSEEPQEQMSDEMDTAQHETTTMQAEDSVPTEYYNLTGDTVMTESGLKYIEIEAGDGEMPQLGQTCVMNATGWFASDHSKFWSSNDSGEPFRFPIGRGMVIKGWDEGVMSMKVGGRRRLIVPSNLAYGPNGRPPQIPPNADLIFDVALVGIQ